MFLLLAAWWVVMLLATAGTLRYRHLVRRPIASAMPDGVVLLVPIKGQPGNDAAVEVLLARCLAQLGPAGRMVVAVADHADPAAAPVAAAARTDPRLTLVLAGSVREADRARGQKVHNLLAALRTLRPEDRFVVFADADLLPAPDWLPQLLRPVAAGRAPLSSGYRWILPADDRLPSRMAALVDWSIATLGRSRRWNLCWGGSTAIERTALDAIDLPHHWSGALLDDLVLTRAARQQGFAIHAPHHVLMVSPVRHGWRSLFAFGRRQYLLVRVHAPRHWWLAGATLLLPIMACLAAPAAGSLGLLTVLAALLLQQVRASLRIAVAHRVLQPDAAARSAALLRRDRWLLPVVQLLHAVLWLSSAVGRETEWAGIRYRLLAPNRVELMEP